MCWLRDMGVSENRGYPGGPVKEILLYLGYKTCTPILGSAHIVVLKRAAAKSLPPSLSQTRVRQLPSVAKPKVINPMHRTRHPKSRPDPDPIGSKALRVHVPN